MLPAGTITVSIIIMHNCYNENIRQFKNFLIFQEMELKISYIICSLLGLLGLFLLLLLLFWTLSQNHFSYLQKLVETSLFLLLTIFTTCFFKTSCYVCVPCHQERTLHHFYERYHLAVPMQLRNAQPPGTRRRAQAVEATGRETQAETLSHSWVSVLLLLSPRRYGKESRLAGGT